METQPLLRTLSTMLIHLNALRTLLESNAAHSEASQQELRDGLQTLEQMTRDVLNMVRISDDDEPLEQLDGMSLGEALSHMVEDTAEQLNLSSRVTFSGDEHAHSLSRATERLLYFIAREALYQVSFHSGARRLRLALSYGSDEVQLSVEDDGLSWTPGSTNSRDLGPPTPAVPAGPETASPGSPVLDALRRRLEQAGGSLQISTEQGTRLVVYLPYTLRDEVLVPQTSASGTPAQAAEEITILLVDSQAVTRAGLRRLLESYAGLRVVGEAADGLQAVSETLELGPRVVLMDTFLPNGQTLEALRQIKQLNLDTRVLLLSAQEREEYLYETLRAGADGYVLKDIEPAELVEAVRTVARGEVLVQPQLASRLLSRFGRQGRATPYETLTARELEVLRLLGRGLRNKEIAARLYVSERTVNFHLANIYQKLNVSGRTEALSRAMELGLITA
ncbi:MAG: response regulator [Ktedonobacteraceae bacterium]|nr:response regulator [Ktedonobacteraceae bacterium]